MQQKELKRKARKTLKKHYAIFMVACLIAAFIGTEFLGSLTITKLKSFPETVMTDSINVDKAVEDALKGNEKEGKQITSNLKKEIIAKDKENQDKILGRSRGVFAMIVNGITTGSIYVTFIAGMNSIIGNPNITSIILIIASLLLSFFFWMLLGLSLIHI